MAHPVLKYNQILQRIWLFPGRLYSSPGNSTLLKHLPLHLCKKRKLVSSPISGALLQDGHRHSHSIDASPRLVAGSKDEEFEFEVALDSDSPAGGQERQRLDAFLSAQLPDVSRAKLQSGIKSGLVAVNGRPQTKTSHKIKWGDKVSCKLPPQAQLDAIPEDIRLDIVHEDDHVMVVNKAAGMVVHPSPGNYTGTLVNALLYHCQLPAMQVVLGNALPSQSLTPSDESEGVHDEEDVGSTQEVMLASLSPNGEMPTIRPGIVHRLDKGTTGLMVVAKDDFSHAHLCQQFKEHTVQRTYQSVLIGVPKNVEGTVETNIVRDQRDRQRMAVTGFFSNRGRHAISHYHVLEEIAACRASLVQWKLETGRTHQIRVHAKHMGHAILADETYSGGASTAVAVIGTTSQHRRQTVQQVVKALARPALHAKTLGFQHPVSKKVLDFTSDLPPDLQAAVDQLRAMQ